MSEVSTPALTSLSVKNVVVSDIAAFIGEVARPFAIISMFASIAFGFVFGKVDPMALGIMVTGGATLYGAKGAEKIVQARADADVKKTQANAESGAPIVDTAALATAGDKQIKAANKQNVAAATQLKAANKTKG